MKRSNLIAALCALALPATALAQPAPTADDLNKAADATADAAAVAPPSEEMAKAADAAAEAASVPATPPPAAAAKDDIDLAALGLDPTAAAAFDDKLNIYGFADVTYQSFSTRKAVPYLDSSRSFIAGAVDLYLAKNQTEHWRSLAEIRMLYVPNGGQSESTGAITNTAVDDPSNFSLPVTWGGISIERAYVEYDVNNYLTVRAGHFLTPYGIWNTDHGSPTIITPNRPYVISQAYFPEHQTGLDFLGRFPVGDYHVGYHATVTNGRNPTETVSDPDKQIALGGRLEFEAPWAGTLKLGVSAYKGRSTSTVTTPGTIPDSYDEVSYAADAMWDHGGWHAQAEFVGNDIHYRDGSRARTATGFSPDARQRGGYALVGYRFDRLWNVMPYTIFEYQNPIEKAYWDHTISESAGLNFRPTPNIVLKAHFTYAVSKGNETTLFGNNTLYLGIAQIAWVF